MKTPFSQPILAAAVAALFAAPSVWAVDVTCDTPTGCNYKSTTDGTTWKVNNDDNNIINEKNVNLTLKAQNYQNEPLKAATHADKEPLIYMVGSEKGEEVNAQLNIAKGTTITLDNQHQDQEAIVINNAKANIEQGVTVHIKPTYAQNQETTPPKLGDYTEAGTAIVAYNDNEKIAKTELNTSADIILDSAASNGLGVAGLARINASNHSITMNKPHNDALVIHNGGEIVANNVTISGNQPFQFGVTLYNDSDFSAEVKKPTLTLNQSKINLSDTEFSVGISAAFGEITLNDSSIYARNGITPYSEKTEKSEKLNIRLNNSTIHGTANLISSRPDDIRDLLDKPDGGYQEVNLIANNSTLKGKIDTSGDPKSRSKVNLTLNNNSSWEAIGAKSIDDIIMSGQGLGVDNLHVDKTSNVYISRSDTGYNTLNIHGDLTGEGNFYLRTEIADLGGDSIRVNGKVLGNHTLYALNSGGEPKDTSGKLRLVQTAEVASDDAFKLGNKNGVVAVGKYLYALQKDGNYWNLVYDNTQSTPTPTQPANPTPPPTQPVTPTQPATPTPPTQPITPIVPITPSQPVAPTPTVNKNFNYSLMGTLAHAQAAALGLQQQNQVLNERQAYLHEHTRSQGLWTNGNISETERKGSQINGGNASGFTDKTKAWQLGYDYRLPNGYVGLLSGQSRHELDYDVDLYENSQVVGDTFALYGGAHFNTWFVDGTLRHTRYTASNPQFARDRFRVNSLNIQGGKQVKLNEQWSLVPQAAITIGRLSGSNMMENSTLLQTQLGADLQGKFAIGGSAWLQPKIGAYYVADHRGVDVKFNNETFRAPNAGHRVAAKVGTDVLFNQGASRIGLQFQTEHGSRLKRPYGVEMGFRHSW